MSKLYCIFAREAETGIIFRRGPRRLVRLIRWNLKIDTFEPGQWFKGQIYVRKSDLTPDGTKLVYTAAKHRGTLPIWTAVSTPPFFTAHVLWERLGTWDGISLFETNRKLALATYRSDSSLEPVTGFAIPPQLQVTPRPWLGFFYKLEDHERLIRDGWTVHAGDPVYGRKSPAQTAPVVYRKPISSGSSAVWLEMSGRSARKLTYTVRDRHNGSVDLAADWADVRQKHILFSRCGKLFRMSVPPITCNDASELADFDDMKFEPIEAPSRAAKW